MEAETKRGVLFILLTTIVILAFPFLVFDFSAGKGNKYCVKSGKILENVDFRDDGDSTLLSSLYSHHRQRQLSNLEKGNYYVMKKIQSPDYEGCIPPDMPIEYILENETVKQEISAWLGKNLDPQLQAEIWFIGLNYGNDWFQVICCIVVLLTWIITWEKNSLPVASRFLFVSLDLLQSGVNIWATNTIGYDPAALWINEFHPNHLLVCSIIQQCTLFLMLSQQLCLSRVVFDVWKTFCKEIHQRPRLYDNDGEFLHLAILAVALPAGYASFGLVMKQMIERRSCPCHPSLDNVRDILVHIVYPWVPPVLFLVSTTYFLTMTRLVSKNFQTERKWMLGNGASFNSVSDTAQPISRLHQFVKLLAILACLILGMKPYAFVTTAQRQYDIISLIVSLCSRSSATVLLFSMAGHDPTLRSLSSTRENLGRKLQRVTDEYKLKKGIGKFIHFPRFASMRIILHLRLLAVESILKLFGLLTSAISRGAQNVTTLPRYADRPVMTQGPRVLQVSTNVQSASSVMTLSVQQSGIVGGGATIADMIGHLNPHHPLYSLSKSSNVVRLTLPSGFVPADALGFKQPMLFFLKLKLKDGIQRGPSQLVVSPQLGLPPSQNRVFKNEDEIGQAIHDLGTIHSDELVLVMPMDMEKVEGDLYYGRVGVGGGIDHHVYIGKVIIQQAEQLRIQLKEQRIQEISLQDNLTCDKDGSMCKKHQ